VFAPVRNLGLIVIDEEHEGTYKSGSTPRYHARQVAMYRSSKAQAALVMGSATPSVEAYHLMSSGRIKRIDLTRRLAGGTLPELSIVDLNREETGISGRLAEEISAALARKRQVILFLNRRGFSYFFHCRTCGFEMKCSRCSVALTYHKKHGRMICHYCGYSTQPVEVCPGCGSLDVGYSGFGTEKVEEDVARLFPKARVGRVDTDSVRPRGTLAKLLKDFAEGELDILLGTQMVAKGLNFPRVDLVGIILADTGLSLPDFRAAERTFQLITQVSGRAGRFDSGGKVIIQTFRPQNPAILRSKKGDTEGFIKNEIENRQMLGFPPFSRLFRFVFRGKKKEKVFEFSQKAASALSRYGPSDDEILGPAECPLSVISGNHRFQLILKTLSFGSAHRKVGRVMGELNPPAGVYIELDVDPVSLL
jgi:primosomal protein N' (replication factor Y)